MLDEIYKDAVDRMQKSVENTRQHFVSIRTGRASTALLDRIMVEYYQTQTPLNQLANIGAPEPRLLTIQPYDKTVIPEVERAIMKSDLGLTPSSDGGIIRIPIPPLTEERRKELVRYVHKLAEDGRIAIRNIRRDANHSIDLLKSEGDVSEDDAKRAHDRIQNDTDEHIKQVDENLAMKEKEILEE